MRQVLSFNNNWAFRKGYFDPKGVVSVKVSWENVTLPHTWKTFDGQASGKKYHHGLGCYIKEFRKSELPAADCYYLEFQGVSVSAIISLNGLELARHDGSYSAWRVDITEAMEDINYLIVRVNCDKNNYVPFYGADATTYSGLHKEVNLIAVSASHFDLNFYGTPGLKVTPVLNVENALVDIETFVIAPHSGQTVHYIIRDAQDAVVAETILPVGITKATLTIPNVHLWNGKKDPYLYHAEALLCADVEILDNVSTSFGCRSFHIDPKQGFILNGEPYPLRFASQRLEGKEIGKALLPKQQIEDMDLMCAQGATAVRLAYYQHDQCFYNLCDTRGMIVWAELPYTPTRTVSDYKNTITQMMEFIVQNYNHPSFFVWGISDEMITPGTSKQDILHNQRLLNDLVQVMDPLRQASLSVSSCCMCDPSSKCVFRS